MTASYESVRHDRRYEIDACGVAEFGGDRGLRRFIPWHAVNRIEFAHLPQHRQVRWSVRAADGSRIRPNLAYTNSLECYNVALSAWRATVPHACRAHFRQVYRRALRAHARIHLLWVIPALFVYILAGLCYGLGVEIPREAIGQISVLTAIG
jgi:hypothetical protein